MFRLAVFALVIATVTCQEGRRVPKYAGDPKTAAILQEARYLSGNGAFGSAYQQEDGIDFKEETDANGDRRGSYSYIDPSGQRKTVNYVAGKNGFQASGDHIPTAPQAAAPTPGYKPDPRYQAPEYQAPQQYTPQYTAPQQYNAPAPARSFGGKQDEDDGQYHPELYEQENYVAPPEPRANYAPQPRYQPQPQYQAQPQPQYQAQPTYNNNIYPGVQQAQYSGVQSQQYTAPAQQQQQQYYEPTTQQPSRFFPPGQFSLNRSPDGYTYSFHKV